MKTFVKQGTVLGRPGGADSNFCLVFG